MNKIITVVSLLLGFLLTATPAFAHAIVMPSTAGIGSYTDFSLGVPSEKDGVSTTAIQLMLPVGLQSISPFVKSGWQVVVKQGSIPAGVKVQPDDDGNLPTTMSTEIDWTGGSIPAGQKDAFEFTAQVPPQSTELDWKVIQTYSDGSTVSWTLGPNDAQPKDDKGNPDFSKFGPYSKTMVINDLKASPSDSTSMETVTSASTQSGLVWIALALSVVAIGLQLIKRK